VVLTQKNTVLSYFMGQACCHATLLKFGDQLLMFQSVTMPSKHQEQTHTISEDWCLQQHCSEKSKTSCSLEVVMLLP